MIHPIPSYHSGIEARMIIRRFAVRLILAGTVSFASAAAVYANQPPIIDSLSADPASIFPNGLVTLSVEAHDPDCPDVCDGSSGCGVYIRSDILSWSVSGGTIVSRDNGVSGSPFSASAVWQAPAAEGIYTIEVYVGDSGGFICGGRESATQLIDIVVSLNPNLPPVVESVVSDRTLVFPGDTAQLLASAYDPDGDPITYSWSTDIGTVVPTGFGTAVFSAPAAPGVATVTCTASDPDGFPGSNSVLISVTGAGSEKMIQGEMAAPQRVALNTNDEVIVADKSAGGLHLFNFHSGRSVGFLEYPGVTSIDIDWNGRYLVGSISGAQVLDEFGQPWMTLPTNPALGYVTDVAIDRLAEKYVVLFGASGQVSVFSSTGVFDFSFGSTGAGEDQFRSPTGLAVGPNSEILIADRGHGQIKVFDSSGIPIRQIGNPGANAGEFTQLDDVAVGSDGTVYASDSFQSWVQAFSWTGSLLEAIGTFGTGVGEFETPSGIAIPPGSNRLMVASLNTSSIQVFQMSSNPPPSPEVDVSPSALTFSSQAVGSTSAARGVTIRNTGISTVQLYGSDVEGDFEQDSDCGSSLDPGASCTIDVVFSPQGEGRRDGLLVVHDGTADGPHEIALVGEGFTPTASNLVLNPLALEFGDVAVGATSGIQSINIGNTGTAGVFLNSIAGTADFAVVSGCPNYLEAGVACSASVTFSPSRPGLLRGQVVIDHSGGGSPSVVSLNGTGIGAALTISPSSLHFGEVPVGSYSGALHVNLLNSGTEPFVIGGATAAGEFIIQESCAGTTLIPGAACSAQVVFKPTKSGTRSGSVTFSHSAPGGSSSIQAAGIGSGADFVLSPGLLDFGRTRVGLTSSVQTAKLISTGNLPLNLRGLTMVGEDSPDFRVLNDGCSGQSLPPGGVCSVRLDFSPSEIGSRSVQATFMTDGVKGDVSLPIVGEGTGFVNLQLAADDGGIAPVPGQSFTYRLAVTNNGNIVAKGTTFEEIVPDHTIFDPQGSDPGWVCSPDGGEGSACTWPIGDVAVGETKEVYFSVILDDPPPLGIGEITNSIFVYDDGSSGEDTSPGDNQAVVISVFDGDPPTVVETTGQPGGILLQQCESVRESITSVGIRFSEPMFAGGDPEDVREVTNPENYRLVFSGPDGDFSTDQCGFVFGDDVSISISGVTYDTVGYEAGISFDSAPFGFYRLLACGSLGLADYAGNPLDGDETGTGGSDFSVDFRYDPENMFANGHLDCDINGWDLLSADPSEIYFSEEDLQNSTISGSVAFMNLAVNQVFSVGQCVVINDQTTMDFSGSIRVESATEVSLEVEVGCDYFSTIDCSGRIIGNDTLFGVVSDTQGEWIPLSGSFSSEPATVAGRCSVTLVQPEGSDFQAFLDGLTLIKEILFADGFESGDTSSWTETISP